MSLPRAAVPAVAAILLCLRPAKADEPRYQGRSVSSWLLDVEFCHTSTIAVNVDTAASERRRNYAAEAIRAIGKQAVPILVERIKKGSDAPDIDYVPRATWALHVLGSDAQSAIPDLIQLLKPAYKAASQSDPSKTDHTSICAAEALQQIGEDSVPGLIKALSAKDEEIRFGAAGALEYFGDDAADIVPALVDSLKDSDWMVRWRSSRTLGSLGQMPEIAVPASVERLRTDSNGSVKSYAIFALQKFGPRAALAIPELKKSAAGSDLCIATYAREALEKIRQRDATQPTSTGRPAGQ